MRGRMIAGAAVLLAVTAACASGIRPAYDPFPQADVDTVNATPVEVIQEIAQRMVVEDIQVQWTSPEEGYIETMWYNIVSRESGVTDRSNPERIVKLRFWADPAGEGMTKVTGEAVLQRGDPSIVNPRDREMMAPPGHAGGAILQRVFDALNERFGG